MKNILIISLFIITFSSCRDQIDLDLPNSDKHALVVEGYVTEGVQELNVKLSLTTSYMNNGVNPVPSKVDYVLIRRTDPSNIVSIDTLKEKIANSGDYYITPTYTPSTGDNYQLEVKYNNELFRAESKIGKKAIIDSVGFKYQKKKSFNPAGYQVQFVCRDQVGKGDYFLFEKYKNGSLYYETINDLLNVWDDGLTDGLVFPPPVLFGINPQPNTDKPGYDENKDYPYTIGDSVNVNVYTIDEKAFRFYNDMLQQSSTASGGALGPLFSPPMDNLRTNIYNLDPKGIKVVGLFSARARVTASIKIK